MTFWDTSAVLTLITAQSGSSELEMILKNDPGMVVWWGTRVEAVSGVCRLRREGEIDEKTQSVLLANLETVTTDADQIEPTEQVRSAAVRVLRIHSVRAGDALQLAAALVWTDHSPKGIAFVCLDKRLRNAAECEGFKVLPE